MRLELSAALGEKRSSQGIKNEILLEWAGNLSSVFQ